MPSNLKRYWVMNGCRTSAWSSLVHRDEKNQVLLVRDWTSSCGNKNSTRTDSVLCAWDALANRSSRHPDLLTMIHERISDMDDSTFPHQFVFETNLTLMLASRIRSHECDGGDLSRIAISWKRFHLYVCTLSAISLMKCCPEFIEDLCSKVNLALRKQLCFHRISSLRCLRFGKIRLSWPNCKQFVCQKHNEVLFCPKQRSNLGPSPIHRLPKVSCILKEHIAVVDICCCVHTRLSNAMHPKTCSVSSWVQFTMGKAAKHLFYWRWCAHNWDRQSRLNCRVATSLPLSAAMVTAWPLYSISRESPTSNRARSITVSTNSHGAAHMCRANIFHVPSKGLAAQRKSRHSNTGTFESWSFRLIDPILVSHVSWTLHGHHCWTSRFHLHYSGTMKIQSQCWKSLCAETGGNVWMVKPCRKLWWEFLNPLRLTLTHTTNLLTLPRKKAVLLGPFCKKQRMRHHGGFGRGGRGDIVPTGVDSDFAIDQKFARIGQLFALSPNWWVGGRVSECNFVRFWAGPYPSTVPWTNSCKIQQSVFKSTWSTMSKWDEKRLRYMAADAQAMGRFSKRPHLRFVGVFCLGDVSFACQVAHHGAWQANLCYLVTKPLGWRTGLTQLLSLSSLGLEEMLKRTTWPVYVSAMQHEHKNLRKNKHEHKPYSTPTLWQKEKKQHSYITTTNQRVREFCILI